MFCELVYNANTGLQSNAECEQAIILAQPASSQLGQEPDPREEDEHVKIVEYIA